MIYFYSHPKHILDGFHILFICEKVNCFHSLRNDGHKLRVCDFHITLMGAVEYWIRIGFQIAAAKNHTCRPAS